MSQNILALGHVVSLKKIFKVFPTNAFVKSSDRQGRALYDLRDII